MMFDLDRYYNHTVAISDNGVSLQYGQLKEEVAKLNLFLTKYKLAFCLCDNRIGCLLGYVAFMNAQVPTVLLDGQKNAEVIQSLLDIYQPACLWLSDDRLDIIKDYPVIYQAYGFSLISYNRDAQEIHHDIALLLTTSGSTGSPKLVKLTCGNLLSNAQSIAEYLAITSEERPITSLPMYYSYGLSVINSHLIKGATILMTDKAVIQKEFWNFAKTYRATSIAGVPYTYEMLRRLHFFRMDLPDLKTMTQAGGKLNAKIAEEYIRNAEETGRHFFVMYGQTEATARMSYLPQAYALEKCTSIGIAIPGGCFSLMDAKGQEIVEPGVDGELVYRGPNVSMGYAGSIADLLKGDENQGVLHTGDIARFDTEGFYYITGRMKRFVKIWGNRCNLDAAEQLVKAAITLNCACVGVDDKLTVFVTEPGLEASIKAFLSKKMGLNVRGFDVRVIDIIPKSPSGKVLYSELQKMLED